MMSQGTSILERQLDEYEAEYAPFVHQYKPKMALHPLRISAVFDPASLQLASPLRVTVSSARLCGVS